MVEVAVKVVSALTRVGQKLNDLTTPRPRQLPIEVEDVQGLVFRGYGELQECAYPILDIQDPARARAWLGRIVDQIAPGPSVERTTAVHIAFTHAGLRKLQLPDEALQGFSREFIAGMTGDHRSRFLGDHDESAPKEWEWGGPKNPPVHIALILFAKDAVGLSALIDTMRAGWTAGGCAEVTTLKTAHIGGLEHFGFADGISQPAIDGYHDSDSALHSVKAGEFILGYLNEYGLFTERPMVKASRDPRGLLPLDVEGSPRRDLGKNGTYLVFRQLRQDVPAFRATLEQLTRNEDGSPNALERERLAARMVGRWPSGASLVEAPERDDASKSRSNEFDYHHADPEGLKCPLGAHVRRANPRNSLAPEPGTERSLTINRRHRLIRRGRAYGSVLPEGKIDGEDRGLMFVAVNGNISRQFEFIQHSWIADPRFNGLSNEADPIAGAAAHNDFAVPGDPIRTRCTGLPRFVTVKGGAYFFLPGIRALRYLAELTP
jgi:Dyp-type peroxidase family